MEAQAKKAFSGDAQPLIGSSSVRFTWVIDRFSTVFGGKLYSGIFNEGGYKWRILIFPTTATDHLSVYLDIADNETLPNGWSKYVRFSLSVISRNRQYTVRKETRHKFNACESDWGFASFIPLGVLYDPVREYLVKGACTIEADVWLNEEDDENELKREEKSDSDKVWLKEEQDKNELDRNLKTDSDKEPTAVKVGKSSSSFAEFDEFFVEIQNLLDGKTSKAESLSSSLLPSCTAEEISHAKKVFEQCLDMDLASVIRFGRASELKYSLSVLLSSNSFPDNMVDGTTKFLADFEQSCEQYEAAQQDLSEADEKEKSVAELKTKVASNMKQLSSEFIPMRNQAEAVDQEIAGLERLLAERKAKRALVSKRLEVLAGRANSSKQALISAEQDMKLSRLKKEQAKKVIGDMESSWESMKADHSPLL